MEFEDFYSQLTALYRCQLRQLGLSQNSIELFEFLEKKWWSSLSIATAWIWRGWDVGSKIFLATWMESVMTIILEMLFLAEAWLMSHLIVNNSAFALVTKATWWIVLMSGWFEMYGWDRCSNVVLDASICCNDGYGLWEQWFNNHWVKLLEMMFVIFFITMIKRKMIWKSVNNSNTQRKFWMKRRERRRDSISSIVRVNKIALNFCFLLICEKAERGGMVIVGRTKWGVHKCLNNVIRWEESCMKLQSASKFL